MATKTTTAKTTTKTTSTKAATNGKATEKAGLRKPQLRILAALAKSKLPLSRKQLSEKAPVDQAACVEYVGSPDAEVRKVNDGKHFPSLVTLGLVRFAQAPEGETGAFHEITAKGREALKKSEA